MVSAISLGISRPMSFRRIIMTFMTNQVINIVKNTSLLSTIAVVEITMHNQIAVATFLRPFDFYKIGALIYLLISSLLPFLPGYFESKQAVAFSSSSNR